jgi:hypothetical protein
LDEFRALGIEFVSLHEAIGLHKLDPVLCRDRMCETQFAQLRGSVGLSVTLGTIALIAIGCRLELPVTLIAIPIDEGTRAVGLGVG